VLASLCFRLVACVEGMKTVYKASSEEKASYELDKLIVKWGQKYSLAVNPWKNSSCVNYKKSVRFSQ